MKNAPLPKQKSVQTTGWIENTWYIVLVSFGVHNPIHKALFFTGFLSQDKTPGGYNGFVALNGPDNECIKFTDAYYLKIVSAICDAEGNLYL